MLSFENNSFCEPVKDGTKPEKRSLTEPQNELVCRKSITFNLEEIMMSDIQTVAILVGMMVVLAFGWRFFILPACEEIDEFLDREEEK